MKIKLGIRNTTKFLSQIMIVASIVCLSLYLFFLFTPPINYHPTHCFFGVSFVDMKTMQNFIIAIGWDTQFKIGEIQIDSHFVQDAYGCGKPRKDGGTDVGLIVLGPTLIVTHK